jgi:type IV secretion system protein VirB10
MTDAADEQGPAAPQKLDPETLVIRARPRPAVRFKRGAVIGLAAAGAGGLSLISWSALRHHGTSATSQATELSQPATAHGDALSALPTTYDSVPKLGPPLPGDLGRPILEHQRALASSSDAGAEQRAAQAADAERERQAAAVRTARESALLIHTTEPVRQAAPSVTEAAPMSAAPGPRALLDPADPSAQQRKLDFVATSEKEGAVNPHALMLPASPYLLSAGSVIAASLITGLRSDLPGIVSAQVTENVYDSPTGRILLVPQGARLIGSYDSVVAFGQKRALVVWQRIVLPDGSSLSLDNLPATDPSGYSGLEDNVDFHTWALLKGVAISTLLGVGAQLQFTGGNDLVEAIRQSTQQSVSRAGDQLTSKALDIQPTITVRPGAPVRLIVHRDLILQLWNGGGSTR